MHDGVRPGVGIIPRTCGEHILLTNVLTGAWGSSPRMRGTRELGGPAAPGLGIIPAHAGNTRCKVVWETQSRDHPRACGEHYNLMFDMQTLMGSSPRMRGTRGLI